MKRFLFLLLIPALNMQGQTLTIGQVYNFDPGDVFQWTYTDYYDMGGPTCFLPSLSTRHTDSIISKSYSLDSGTIYYTVHWTTYMPLGCAPTTPPSHNSGSEVRSYTNLSQLALDTADDCNPDVDSFYVAYCGKNVWRRSNPDDFCFEHPAWSYDAIEGCGVYGSYRGGYGGEPHYSSVLNYYKKGTAACGTFSTTGITELDVSELSVYPNPGSGLFDVNYSLAGSNAAMKIYDLGGKKIWESNLREGMDQTIQIDLSAFENGIYLYRIGDEKEIKTSGKIVIVK
ncbi:MAG: T9SS type A sorting domain-containing protein [Bacteroidia bacterium]